MSSSTSLTLHNHIRYLSQWEYIQCQHLIPALNTWAAQALCTTACLIATKFFSASLTLHYHIRYLSQWEYIQCQHLIPALNTWAAQALCTTTRPIATKNSSNTSPTLQNRVRYLFQWGIFMLFPQAWLMTIHICYMM